MANDIWTAPSGPSAGVIGLAEMQQQRTDNIYVLGLAIDGDGSASTKKHRHKTGTLAARPAAGEAGRIYRATDINCVFWDDGTNWRFLSGAGLYDSFARADSSTITPADSGHAWVEETGNLEIASNALRVVAAASVSRCSADLGGILDDVSMSARININTPAVAADIATSFMARYLDDDNYLLVNISGPGSLFRIRKVVAGVPTTLRSMAFTPSASTSYMLHVVVAGPVIIAEIHQDELAGGSNVFSTGWAVPADTVTPFVGATKVGIEISNDVADKVGLVAVKVSG